MRLAQRDGATRGTSENFAGRQRHDARSRGSAQREEHLNDEDENNQDAAPKWDEADLDPKRHIDPPGGEA